MGLDQRPYPQIVSGGPQPETSCVIRGRATRDNLHISATMLDGREVGQWSFQARRKTISD